MFNIPEFQSFHSTRTKKAGGVSIFVKTAFSDTEEVINYEDKDCNFLVVEVKTLKTKIITAYKPPSTLRKKAIKIIKGLPPRTRSITLFSEQRLPLPQLLEYLTIILAFKIEKLKIQSHKKLHPINKNHP